MTKFLKQTCILETAIRDENGDIQHNKYGETLYNEPIVLKCRHERITQDVLTANGSIIRSGSRYFTDETHVIQTDDKLDGSVVTAVEEYINGLGLSEGFESYA